MKLSLWENTHTDTTDIHLFYYKEDLFFRNVDKNCPFHLIYSNSKSLRLFPFLLACAVQQYRREEKCRVGRKLKNRKNRVWTGQSHLSGLQIESWRLGCGAIFLWTSKGRTWQVTMAKIYVAPLNHAMGCISHTYQVDCQLTWALFCHWCLWRHLHFA